MVPQVGDGMSGAFTAYLMRADQLFT